MATDKDLTQIEVGALAADIEEQTSDEKEEESQLSTNYVSYSSDGLRRNTSQQAKLGKLTSRVYTKVKSKFKNHRCCLWSSKAVVLILLWNLIISIGFKSFLDPSLYTVTMFNDIYYVDDDYFMVVLIYGLAYGMSALLFLFYPLAGFLADVCWGRYTTVKNSLCFLFWSIVSMSFVAGLGILGSTTMIMRSNDYEALTTAEIISQYVTIAVLCLVFGLPVLCGVVLFFSSTVAFSANVIQFGFDQLHDSPAESSTLYIHWYVWTNLVGLFLLRLPSAVFSGVNRYIAYAFSPVLALIALIFLGISLCFEKSKRHWFLIEPGSTNPYKLVYKIVKFAKDHTNPIRRSAFTYCEDELPSRLDLGKEKYGGPFTTEQVENVKAFLGIVRVLLTVGPIFFADIAFIENLPGLVHTNTYSNYYYLDAPLYAYVYGSGCLTPLLMLILIPFYLCLLRPFIHDYIPGMLKRMGLGMVLRLISGFCTFLMGLVNHNCSSKLCSLTSYFNISPHFLLFQFILNAVSYLLIYIASYEFVCAQSPQSMKGLLIGTFFAIKGVFELFGVVLYLAVGIGCSLRYHFPICGFIYYFINVVIALVGIIAFVFVARRYQYRERDEPDNIYRYAEEYYANAQDETSYGYNNDDDNLNVETIIRN